VSGVAKLGFNERKSSVGVGAFLTGERAPNPPIARSDGYEIDSSSSSLLLGVISSVYAGSRGSAGHSGTTPLLRHFSCFSSFRIKDLKGCFCKV